MGEMKKVVTAGIPVEELPEAIRRGIDDGTMVRVTVEVEEEEQRLSPRRSLRSFLGSGPGLYKSPEEAVAYIRRLRDEWDD